MGIFGSYGKYVKVRFCDEKTIVDGNSYKWGFLEGMGNM